LHDLVPLVALGASPRATLGLVAAARALALLRGREYVVPADVHDLAVDVIAHRLLMTFDAVADGVDPRQVVERLVQSVAPPRVSPHQDESVSGAA
jgi:MoxR-like ATPase